MSLSLFGTHSVTVYLPKASEWVDGQRGRGMAYSQFRNLGEVANRFDLELQTQERLFDDVSEVVPSNRLNEDLEDKAPLALQIDTEKARSEMIITPVLVELRELKIITYPTHGEKGDYPQTLFPNPIGAQSVFQSCAWLLA